MGEQRGVVRTGALVLITVAATNTVLYIVDTGRSVQRATPTAAGGVAFIIRRLWLYSQQAAPVTIDIGELVAAVWTPRLPTIDLLSLTLQPMGEGTLLPIPAWRFTSSAIIRSSAATVPLPVQALAEVIILPDQMMRG